MLLYIIISCILLLLMYASFYHVAKKRVLINGQSTIINVPCRKFHEKSYAFFLLVFFWFLTAYRHISIGSDTANYVKYFIDIQINGIDATYPIEIGYQILCYFIGLWTSDPHVFLFTIATICYAGIGVYIFKYSNNKILSTCLFFGLFFSSYTSMLRQAIAEIIVLYAYQNIKQRKPRAAFVLILLAITFHQTAIIALGLFFSRLCPKTMKPVVILSGIIAFLGVTGIISNMLSKLSGKYVGYFSSEYAKSGYLAVIYNIFRNIIFCSIIYSVYPKNSKDVCKRSFVLLVFCSSLAFSMNLFIRASEYFIIPAITELPNALALYKKKTAQYITAVIFLLTVGFFIISLIIRPEWNSLYPYSFWSAL